MKFDFDDFDISSDLGFVSRNPAAFLPPSYDLWNNYAKNVGILSTSGHLRRLIDQMPVLSVDPILANHKFLRLAHVQLSTLVSGYVWCDGELGVPRYLPESLAIPFWKVCRELGIEPGIASHIGLALANYKLKDENGNVHLDNLELLYFKFLEDYGNDWFFLLTTQVELDFADALPAILDIIRTEKLNNNDVDRLSKNLKIVAQTIEKMERTLGRMRERLEPRMFFYGFRPYLAGTTSGLYEQWGGIVLKGIDSEPKKLIGGSAAQSSTLQVLDGLLNVEHEKSVSKYFHEIRNYLLPKHRYFIEFVAQESHLHERILNNFRLNPELAENYNQCLSNLVKLRNRHIQTVTSFIINPQQKGQENGGNENLKNQNNKYETLNDVGTGGTGFMHFLKSTRDSTAKKMIFY
uniref:Indoleamine 2,3-dioxygenase n=1 Tax=Romanomermis culicivorax TaxID=13658 RepID=A0A915HZ89_ROMCU